MRARVRVCVRVLQERVVAGRDGMMESLSARYDIFIPEPSAAAAGGSDAQGRKKLWSGRSTPFMYVVYRLLVVSI